MGSVRDWFHQLTDKIFSEVEQHPLLESLEEHRDEVAGGKKKGPRGPDEKELLKAEGKEFLTSLVQMYRYATAKDMCLLGFGIIFSFIHGSSFPVLALLLGTVSETFIAQSYGSHNISDSYIPHGNSNLTRLETNITATDIMKKMMGGNNSAVSTEAMFSFAGNFLGSFGPQGPLSRDEFVDYACTLSLVYFVMGLIVFISSFVQSACFEWAADNQAYRIRQHFLFQVLRQEMSWFETRAAGYLIVKLADDVERVREGIGHKLSIAVEYSSCFIVGAFFGLSTNWKLAMIFGTSVPFILTKLFQITKNITMKALVQQEEYGEAGAISAEVLSHVRTVAACGTEGTEGDLYEEELNEGIDAAINKYSFIGVWTGILHIIVYCAYAGGFWYACNQLVQGGISAREIYTVFFCVSVGVLALLNLFNFVSTIANAIGSSKNLNTIIDHHPTIDPYNPRGRKPKKVKGKIKLTNVSFHYQNRDDILVVRDLNLEIEAGKTVAIVGESGSGKSTIVNLLLRFYEPQSGQITFDDADIKCYNMTWLREQICIVPQNPVFDEETIYNNILGPRTDATPEDVETAAKLACAHDFIVSFPERYETKIGLTGKQLSVRQKQRLALARVLIKKPSVLILDELLSGLDSNMARQLFKNIKGTRPGLTTILISHRLAHIKKSDKIFVLKGGEIHESGTHKELMDQNGLYHEMAQEEHILKALEAAEGSAEENPFVSVPVERNGDSEKSEGDVDIDIDFAAFAPDSTDTGMIFPTLNDLYQMLKDEDLGKYICLGLIGAIICGSILPLFAIVFSDLFITLSEHGDQLLADAGFWVKAVLVIGIISGFGLWMRTLFVSTCGEYLSFRLRATAYRSLTRQAIGWFDDERNSTGKLYTRLASDGPFVKVAVGNRLGTAISAVVSITAAIIIAFVFEWQLGLVILSAVPFLIISLYIQSRIFEGHQMEITKHMELAIKLATKSVQNIWTIQSLNLEQHILRRFKNILDPAFKEMHMQSMMYSLICAITEILPFLVFAGVFRLGAHLMYADNIDSIYLFKAFIVLAFCAITVAHITSYTPDYVKAKLAMAHIYSIYELESTIDAYEPVGAKRPTDGEIEFNDVHFSYPLRKNVMVLQGVSFKVEAGTSLGIIGAKAGKSTILMLLERFYDVDQGEVLIDGFPTNKLKLAFLRGNIGYVAQEPTLFDRTIRENLEYGYTDGADDEDEILEEPEEEEEEEPTGLCSIFTGMCKRNEVEEVEGDDEAEAAEIRGGLYRIFKFLRGKQDEAAAEEEKENEEEKTNEEEKPKELDEDEIEEEEKEFIARMQEIVGEEFTKEFVELGLDSEVGYLGCRLTGGQRQRISITRALLRNPKILLLDEPISGLDRDDERMIQQVLAKAKEGRTCIIVSNRPSIIRTMDKVVVLVAGKVEEYGTHDELMEQNGLYKEFMQISKPDPQHS